MPRPPYYLDTNAVVFWPPAELPVDWTACFGRTAPLEVEIGFGNGEALTRRAAERPGVNFIGLELAWASIKRCMRRVAKAGLTNVRVLQADAAQALFWLFPPGSIAAIRSDFPPPWPKSRHERRRLFSTEFMTLANNRLAQNGRVRVFTDHDEFADWVLDQAVDAGFSTSRHLTPARMGTKYERKWQAEGQRDFHEIVLTKTASCPPPPEGDSSVQYYRVDRFDPQNFKPRDEKGPVTVRFKEFLFDPVREKAMVRVLTAEGLLTQEFWLRIEHQEGHWLVGLAPGSAILPTEAVRRAVELTREGCGE